MRSPLVSLLESLVRLYFPRRVLVGGERLPPSGPVLFVLNHPNGLLDPVVLRVALGRPVRFLAKSTLFGNPLGRMLMKSFGALPVYRRQDVGKGGGDTSGNERTFALCREALRAGDPLALFPEGVSHADAQLKPLKTGAARIALSAEREADWRLGLTVVPVGLDYESRTVFRSGVVLEVGEPFAVAQFREHYERDEHGAVDALTEKLREALGAVVLQADTRELLDGIASVSVWTSSDTAARDDLEARHARARELLGGYRRLADTDPARLERVVERARSYARTLQQLGVKDPWALEVGEVTAATAARVTAKLLALAPLALGGAALGWVPYRLAGELAKRYAGEDEDVLGTMKLLAGMSFLAVAWAGEVTAAGALAGPVGALGVAALALGGGYAALRFDETLGESLVALEHLWTRTRQPEFAAQLAAFRRALASEVAEALRAPGEGTIAP